jgi:hypothetical protein
MSIEAAARQLVALADWSDAPVRTEWGDGMAVADIALTNDETLTIYASRAAIAALDAALPKPLDDPRLQGLFSDAISGALAFGAQNTNQPPAGHWLERFWQMGRAERELSEAAPPAAEPAALTDEVLRYAMAAMGTGSPMDAEKFRLFWRYAHDAAMGQLK